MEKELNIIPPEGWEIDLEKSDLTKNKIIYKEKEDNKLPNIWEDALERYPNGYYIDEFSRICGQTYDDRDSTSIYISQCLLKDTAEKLLALTQVLFLRDIYRQGWKPTNHSNNYIIWYNKADNILCLDDYTIHSKCLSFQSEEIRNLFYNNFEDLIIKCKDLI